MRCANLIVCKSFVEARDAPHNIRSTDVEFNEFDPLYCRATSHDADSLEGHASAMFSTRFVFKHSEINIAMEPYAHSPKSIMSDWMHVYMASNRT